MLKHNITFIDFNGTERTKDLYFNLTEFELTEMQFNSPNGVQFEMLEAVADKDMRRLLAFVKMLVNASYGEKSEDGLHFEKSPAIMQRFENSAPYNALMMSLFQDEGARLEAFINGVMPPDLIQRAIEQSQGQTPDLGIKLNARQQNELFLSERQEAAQTPTHADEAPQAPQFKAPVYNETSDVVLTEDAPQPFRIKETPLESDFEPDILITDAVRESAEADDRAAFEAWKAQQNQQ